MKKHLLTIIALLLVFTTQSAVAQQKTLAAKPANPRIFPLDELRPGMKGVARTVFSGTEPQEFDVEILGVLPGYPAPRQSAIIARLSGPQVEKTSVFAGMSGSPVYIDGRLAGAIAFSFPFAKEPICGITPIQEMIDIFADGSGSKAGPREPRSISFTQLASTDWKPNLPKQAIAGAPMIASVSGGSPLVALMGQQIQPIATPVVFGGISQQALNLFASDLVSNGLLPLSGAGGAAAITPMGPVTEKTLAPGTSVSVQLVRGDYSIAASGTVTMRDGDQIYAFGHPFLSLGTADMPMAESSVVTVIANTNNSFKLAVPGQMVGAVSQDRATGVFGKLRQSPRMIPVKIKLHTSRARIEEFSYEVANDPFLTPLLVNLTIYNTITASERSLGESTISIRGTVGIKGQAPVELERRFSAANAPVMAAGSIAVPVAALLTSGFDNVQIDGISLDIVSSDTKYAATLERISLDRNEARRGENIEIQAYVRTDSGKQFVQRIPVQIPADAPPGQLVIFVGDGGALQESSGAKAFVPQDLGQLVTQINKIRKDDRLYVKLFRITPGVVIGTSELPNLPPSVVATLNNDRSSGGYTAMPLSPLFEKELAPADFVINGQQVIAIEVIR
ncbi:MAG: hypothetical protein QOE77_1734 [Blastocatellia bacterium]|jgi:hypothetical protein|nr:hypothetical protein [Blastocatellia bacterium]